MTTFAGHVGSLLLVLSKSCEAGLQLCDQNKKIELQNSEMHASRRTRAVVMVNHARRGDPGRSHCQNLRAFVP